MFPQQTSRMFLCLIFSALLLCGLTAGAPPPIPIQAANGGCSSVASELLDLVNDYRESEGLSRVPHSCSLCTVADAHTKQYNSNPQLKGHDWEDCSYDGNMACMGDKPRELTNYQGEGFENMGGGTGFSMTPAEALDMWKTSPGHNDVILNQGEMWSNLEWNAMGASVDGGFAVLWFGKEVDTNCNDRP